MKDTPCVVCHARLLEGERFLVVWHGVRSHCALCVCAGCVSCRVVRAGQGRSLLYTYLLTFTYYIIIIHIFYHRCRMSGRYINKSRTSRNRALAMRAGAYGADVWAATQRSRGRPRRRPAGRRRRQQQQPQPHSHEQERGYYNIMAQIPRYLPRHIYTDKSDRDGPFQMAGARQTLRVHSERSARASWSCRREQSSSSQLAARSSELCSSNNKSSREAR